MYCSIVSFFWMGHHDVLIPAFRRSRRDARPSCWRKWYSCCCLRREASQPQRRRSQQVEQADLNLNEILTTSTFCVFAILLSNWNHEVKVGSTVTCSATSTYFFTGWSRNAVYFEGTSLLLERSQLWLDCCGIELDPPNLHFCILLSLKPGWRRLRERISSCVNNGDRGCEGEPCRMDGRIVGRVSGATFHSDLSNHLVIHSSTFFNDWSFDGRNGW